MPRPPWTTFDGGGFRLSNRKGEVNVQKSFGAQSLLESIDRPFFGSDAMGAGNMSDSTTQLPPLPEIGHPESWYAKRIHDAEQNNDMQLRESLKVAQYISLALDPALDWDAKLKYFRHALRRHCQPPPFNEDPAVHEFYQSLRTLVKDYCGAEALRLASAEDDNYAARLSMDQSREQIEDDAEAFFSRIIGPGTECPEWFKEEDWRQLKLIRDQWI